MIGLDNAENWHRNRYGALNVLGNLKNPFILVQTICRGDVVFWTLDSRLRGNDGGRAAAFLQTGGAICFADAVRC